MKHEEIIVLGLAGLAVFFIVKGGATSTRNARGLRPALAKQSDAFGAAGGTLWTDTEAVYQGTWTANGALDLNTYEKQIYD